MTQFHVWIEPNSCLHLYMTCAFRAVSEYLVSVYVLEMWALSNVTNICMVLSKLITVIIRIHQSFRTRGNGMKLYKEQCSIDARLQFFSNRIVDIWNSLPAAVVLSPSVPVFKRNLSKLTFSSFLHYP